MNKDNLSLWLGVIVAVLVAGLLFAYFHAIKTTKGEITVTASKTENTIQEYEVKKGDTLWKIAKEQYGDGFSWTKIYASNKNIIANPDSIEAGTKILIPPPEVPEEIRTYTVQKGDSLWKIGVTQCGSGYVWSGIARQNKLDNPEVIHAGNVLKFRCK